MILLYFLFVFFVFLFPLFNSPLVHVILNLFENLISLIILCIIIVAAIKQRASEATPFIEVCIGKVLFFLASLPA